MKYMLLLHHNEDAFGQFSERERDQMLAESVRVTHQLRAKGQYIDAAPLHPTSSATSVRVRNGKRMVTDGPFAETHEQLAGYFLIDVEDLDEAIAVAAQIPGARIGTAEIRPVKEITGLP
jgi:hypothetical protein